MNDELEELYNDLIMEHGMNSYNKKELDNANYCELGHNPSCGDEIEIELKVEDGKIEDMAFKGHGCAISQASTSIMIDVLKGKTIAEAKEVLEANGFEANIGSAQDAEIITDQVPKPGVSLPSNGQVFLYTDTNSEERTNTTVPNIKGMTYEQSKSVLNKAGFNISVSGSGIVTSQEPSSGSELEQGLIVEVSLKPKSNDTH